MKTNWKQELLKSGLPFEYEVQECFVRKGCTVWGEFTYLREDEERVKEFSCDIDANYWKGGYGLDFMIECKYKVNPTKWFFLPHPYKYQDDLDKNDFFHPVDHFSKHSFIFNQFPYSNVFEGNLGPFCVKGTELFENQFLDINIRKAIHQLSYCFVNRVIDCFMNQLTVSTFKNSIFLNVPIVVTNAELYLVNENVTTDMIQSATSIEEISSKQNFLLFYNKIGVHLKEYNKYRLLQFFKGIDEKIVSKSMCTFTKDINFLIDVYSSDYCPRVILFMHHSKDHKNYNALFDYINSVLEPDNKTKKKLETAWEDFEKKYAVSLAAIKAKKNMKK
jgi:hypothetical protein